MESYVFFLYLFSVRTQAAQTQPINQPRMDYDMFVMIFHQIMKENMSKTHFAHRITYFELFMRFHSKRKKDCFVVVEPQKQNTIIRTVVFTY